MRSNYGREIRVDRDTVDGSDVRLQVGDSPDSLLTPRKARRLALKLLRAAEKAERRRA